MHIVPTLGAGGMENGVVNLCNRLDRKRFEISICALETGGALETRIDRRSVALVHVARHFGNDPSVPLRIAWEVARRNVDIVHTHSWGSLLEGFAGGRLGRAKTIIHGEHGTIEERRRNVRVQRCVWKRVDRVIAVSTPLADRMAQTIGFPREAILEIDNGVDTSRFRPLDDPIDALRTEFGLPCDVILVGMVARFVPVKNHDGVLRSIAILQRQGISVHLGLIGDGPWAERLKSLARELRISRRVHFLGETQQVERFLNSLDVFVLNSHSEGMSNVILEAMACGVPVVTTDVGASRHQIGDDEAGRLVRPDDHVDLARAIRELASDGTKRRKLGQEARRRIDRHFSIDSMVQNYERLYESGGSCVARSN